MLHSSAVFLESATGATLSEVFVEYLYGLRFIWITKENQPKHSKEFFAGTLSNYLARLGPNAKQHIFLRLSAQVSHSVEPEAFSF